jgi:competence protein ComEC
VLLTGDIERKVERQLLASERNILDADVLIAPHHGSKTSSSVPFIRAVSPRYVLYSAGYLNRFHHPAMKIVQRYREMGVKQLDTAMTGAIRIMFAGRGNIRKPEIYRKMRYRPWRRDDGKADWFM